MRPLLSLDVIKLAAVIQGLNYYAEGTQRGTYAIALTSMPFPLKIFTFMFRPLFFDAKDFFSFLMSSENIILLLIFIYPIAKILLTLKIKLINFNALTIFLITYVPSSWLLYSFTVANLGTANRYKLMFLPGLICLSLIISSKSKVLIKNEKLITNE